MTIVYALVSRQKTVLAEFTATSGEKKETETTLPSLGTPCCSTID